MLDYKDIITKHYALGMSGMAIRGLLSWTLSPWTLTGSSPAARIWLSVRGKAVTSNAHRKSTL